MPILSELISSDPVTRMNAITISHYQSLSVTLFNELHKRTKSLLPPWVPRCSSASWLLWLLSSPSHPSWSCCAAPEHLWRWRGSSAPVARQRTTNPVPGPHWWVHRLHLRWRCWASPKRCAAKLVGENVTENKQKPEKVRVSLGFLWQKNRSFQSWPRF